jgi:hypothetical protein
MPEIDAFADVAAEYARILVLSEMVHEIAHKVGENGIAKHAKAAGLAASQRLDELSEELDARGQLEG